MSTTRHVGSGKVRELFEVDDDKLVLVASDRISAYDLVLPQDIPDKGKVLTGLSSHWFEVFEDIPNHCLSCRAEDLPDVGVGDLAGRAMLCLRAEPMPIEFVVRGYLSGSGWRDYRSSGEVCGHRLPQGMLESAELPEPLLTPATKAVTGHDENISEGRAAELVGAEAYEQAKHFALTIYGRGKEVAGERGVIIADTKFEFGLIDGEVLLIDEVLTPDSSRFWARDSYAPGGAQASFDKQFVRDWLDARGWDHSPPPPDLPDDVVAATRRRYIEAYERVAARPYASWIEQVTG